MNQARFDMLVQGGMTLLPDGGVVGLFQGMTGVWTAFFENW